MASGWTSNHDLADDGDDDGDGDHVDGSVNMTMNEECDCEHNHQANPELCSYMGCVGKDDSSRILAEKVFFLIFFHHEATVSL